MGGRKRKILVVAPEPFYEDRGTPIAVRQLLEALVECGHEVDLLTYPVGERIDLPGVRILRSPRLLPIDFVPIGFSWRKLALDVGLVWELRRRLRTGDYRAVHAVEEAAFPAVLLSRQQRIPVVYDMQSSLPEGLAEVAAFRVPPLPRLFRRLERWLLREASYVVSSTGLAYRVGRLAPKTPHREWRFASSPPVATREQVARLRAELGIPPEAHVVLYSGNCEPYQGIPHLLRAIPMVRRAHPQVVFVLVGLRPGDRQRLLAGNAALGESATVSETVETLLRDGFLRLVEHRPRDQMPVFYGLADVLVSPRVSGSNLPLKVLDYMGTGRPVVATDIPAHRAVLNESRAALVRPDPSRLAAAIGRLLADPALRSMLGKAAARYSAEHLGRETFVEAIRQMYEEVIDPTPAEDRRSADEVGADERSLTVASGSSSLPARQGNGGPSAIVG